MTPAERDRLQAELRAAFAEVPRPSNARFTETTSGEEYEEASAFFGQTPEQVGHAQLVQYREVLFWFTPEAFHYFLPAFLREAVARDDPDALYVDMIVRLLMEPDDAFARARWKRLSDLQNRALHAWLAWLRDQQAPESSARAELEWALLMLEKDAFRR